MQVTTQFVRGLSLPPTVKPTIPPQSDLDLTLVDLAKPVSKNDRDQAIAWEAARLRALFRAMYNEGVAAGADTDKLEGISRKIEHLESGATDVQQRKLAKIKACVSRVFAFEKETEEFRTKVMGDVEKALTVCNERIYTEEILFSVRDIILPLYSCLISLKKCEDAIKKLPAGPSKMRAQWELTNKIRFFSLSLEVLYSRMADETEMAFQYLKNQWKQNPNRETALGFQDFFFLLEDASILIRGQNTSFGLIKADLIALSNHLTKVKNQIPKHILAQVSIEAVSFNFNSNPLPWRQNYRISSPIAPSKEWSPETKDIIYRLLALIQLTGQGLHMAHELSFRKEKAEKLLSHALTMVPQDSLQRIERETSYVGTLLADKYRDLGCFLEVTKGRSQAVVDALLEAQNQFGTTQPTDVQIFAFMDAYRIQEMLKISPLGNPFNSMTFGEWWDLFSSDPKGRTQKSAEAMSAISMEKPFLGRLIHSIAQQPKEAAAIMANQMSIGMGIITRSHQKLERLQTSMSTQFAPYARELQQLAMPAKDCTLLELSAWLQKVDDLHDSIQEMSNREFLEMDLHSKDRSVFSKAFEVLKSYLQRGEFYTELANRALRQKLIVDPSAISLSDPILRVLYTLSSIVNIAPLLHDLQEHLSAGMLVEKPDPSIHVTLGFLIQRKFASPDFVHALILKLFAQGPKKYGYARYHLECDAESFYKPKIYTQLRDKISLSLNLKRSGQQKNEAFLLLAVLTRVDFKEWRNLAQHYLMKGFSTLFFRIEHYVSFFDVFDALQTGLNKHPQEVSLGQKYQHMFIERVTGGFFAPDLKIRLEALLLLELAQADYAETIVSKVSATLKRVNRTLENERKALVKNGLNSSDPTVRLATLYLVEAIIPCVPETDLWKTVGPQLFLAATEDLAPEVRAKADQWLKTHEAP